MLKLILIPLTIFFSQSAYADSTGITGVVTSNNHLVNSTTISTTDCKFEGAVKYGNDNKIYACKNIAGNLRWTLPPTPPMRVNSADITVRTATATAWRWPTAIASCLTGERVIGGGGACYGGGGFNFIYYSNPSGNSWHIGCDTPWSHFSRADAYAVCLKVK